MNSEIQAQFPEALKKFLKEWWEVFAIIAVFLLLRAFVFTPIYVKGHSMDPTLQDGEHMIMMKHTKLERFDIVVSREPGVPKENIIKRVIGLPGDVVAFDHDQLTINGKKYDEPYLDAYKKSFKEDKLQKAYSYSSQFQQLAKNALCFTESENHEVSFSVTVPEGHYYLMGDDRLVSKDSRMQSVGFVPASDIKGEAKLSFWPLSKFKLINGA